ncbi:MAG TPA: hypothetical protein PK175_08255 [Syntrophales bacterium]|jgi:hypothetical protein|nr:hypothetical protein [Syntrophales bacterium]HON23223.1 hypothetical protein [Syntrophales bacterium]HOU76969.1 hypothetical protein [Syntrophales bacterium]HPC32249.1 hypothetical protein [Syntrophales bacterium]HQG34847.1 hypothetical protein [Syntrophales bacterium]
MNDRTSEALLREMQTRFNKKLREQEIAVVEHWHEQLNSLLSLRPEGVAALQNQIRKVVKMMENRIMILKRSPQD